MRAVVQRVSSCKLYIDSNLYSSIGKGFLVLLGIEDPDDEEDVVWLTGKLSLLRIFGDNEGVMNLNINETGGSAMVVSQFTLHASTKKGNRPSYIRAARPEKAIPLYEKFLTELGNKLSNPVATGIFGAHMDIELVNDGPVTILFDTKNKE